MQEAYPKAGDPGRAIVVSKGADQEGQSAITRADAPVIVDAPGIAKDKDGKPLADRGLNMGVPVLRKDGSKGFTTMRGLGRKGQGVRPELHIVAGPHVSARQARTDRGHGRPGACSSTCRSATR